jgi:hypothetical protein
MPRAASPVPRYRFTARANCKTVRHRVLAFELDGASAQHLSRAIAAYAHAAFPDGGSECAQVSREALLDIARQCDQHTGGELPLRKRQLGQLRAAVTWYFSEVEPGSAEIGEQLGAVLSGTARPT